METTALHYDENVNLNSTFHIEMIMLNEYQGLETGNDNVGY